jgi:hypothetical protein
MVKTCSTPGGDGDMILPVNIKSDVDVWTGFIWLCYNSLSLCCKHGNGHRCFERLSIY